MSLIETLSAWDAAVQFFDRDQHSQALNKLKEIPDPSSKILYNIACIQTQQGSLHESLKYLNACLEKDGHLAVGFYQKGILLFLLERYEESLDSFKQCLTRLRGKSVIDYKQLGLNYILHECEILHNTGVVHAKLSDTSQAIDLLHKAQGCKREPKHKVIDDSLKHLQSGNPIMLLKLPKEAIFRPPKSKTSNIGKQNYLGTAKVISSVKENDTFSGFIGPQKIEEEKKKGLSKSGPPSPVCNRRAERDTSPASLLQSPIKYIKESLNSSPESRSRSLSPSGKQSPNRQRLDTSSPKPKISLTPPLADRKPVNKPPPPSKPAPRFVVTEAFRADDLLKIKKREAHDRSRRRWTMAIGQIIEQVHSQEAQSPVSDSRTRSQSPSGRQSKATNLGHSPSTHKPDILSVKPRTTLTPSYDKRKPVNKPPPPVKPAPRLAVAKTIDTLNNKQKVKDRSRRRWTVAIEHVIEQVRAQKSPEPISFRNALPYDHNKNDDLREIESHKPVLTFRDADVVRRNIPPPPSKPLPVPPVPQLSPYSQERKSKSVNATVCQSVHSQSSADVMRETPETSQANKDDAGKPALPPRDYRKLKKPLPQRNETINVVFNCNHPVTVEVLRGLSLGLLIKEACETFHLTEDSTDLWWHSDEKAGIVKIESDEEMREIWRGLTGTTLFLWCYARQ